MSRRYWPSYWPSCWPSMIGCVFLPNPTSMPLETIVPNLRSADQAGIRSQRRQRDLYPVGRNQPAILPDHLAHSIQKQVCAFHHTAAQHYGFWSKRGDEIRQSKPQVICLALHGTLRPFIRVLHPRADFAGTEIAVSAIGGRIFPEPLRHRRPSRQTLPAAAHAARTGGSRGIDDMVPDLGMTPVHAAVHFAIQNQARANARSHGHVEKARLWPSGSPAQFAKRGCIRVVFQGPRDTKLPRHKIYRIAALPPRQIVHVSQGARRAVERAGATDANPVQLDMGPFSALPKQRGH